MIYILFFIYGLILVLLIIAVVSIDKKFQKITEDFAEHKILSNEINEQMLSSTKNMFEMIKVINSCLSRDFQQADNNNKKVSFDPESVKNNMEILTPPPIPPQKDNAPKNKGNNDLEIKLLKDFLH